MFKGLEYEHSDIKAWILSATNETLLELGIGDELKEEVYRNYDALLEGLRKEDNHSQFDFYKLFFAEDNYKSAQEFIFQQTWMRAIPYKWLKRNWFIDELFWLEDPNCSGYHVDDNDACDLRPKELQLLQYTPKQCVDGTIKDCENLIVYTRLS